MSVGAFSNDNPPHVYWKDPITVMLVIQNLWQTLSQLGLFLYSVEITEILKTQKENYYEITARLFYTKTRRGSPVIKRPCTD